MTKINSIFVVLLCFSVNALRGQEIVLKGKVVSSEDVENIHVINKTSKRFTITDESGAFQIPVKRLDTIVFSSLQHQEKEIVVYDNMYHEAYVEIPLVATTYALDEVVVGKILTGNIIEDIGQVEGEPITAKKLGIPSYQGPLMSLNQRRLYTAQSGGPLGMLINAITGRTKKLKLYVELEKKDALLDDIKKQFSEELFYLEPLEEIYQMEYFYYCTEDAVFEEVCRSGNDMAIIEFLHEKLKEFKSVKNI